MLMIIYTIKTVSVGKKIVDKLLEECTENTEEVKLAKVTSAAKGKNSHKCSFVHCILCYFQYFLQLMLELVVILYLHWYLKRRCYPR